MCAVIGYRSNSCTTKDLETIRRLFVESRIRGKHATGVSYLKDGKIFTIKESIPADRFIKKHDPKDWVDNGSITFIGHCRYSTSDLMYNQPIADSELSLVHNGVISQELPHNWSFIYGIECETRNDSELLFRTIKNGEPPSRWVGTSISCIWLTAENGIQYYRNGKRPLWKYEELDKLILTSTKDIAYRAGIIHGTERVRTKERDLQPEL